MECEFCSPIIRCCPSGCIKCVHALSKNKIFAQCFILLIEVVSDLHAVINNIRILSRI